MAQHFDIRVRLTDIDAQDVTYLAEAVEAFVEAEAVPGASVVLVTAGPVDADLAWEQTAMDNLNEMIG